MKTKILVGAVVALMYGGAALAENKDCPPGTKDQSAAIETQPVDQGIGGSGQVGTEQNVSPSDQSSVDQDLGVSGQTKEEQGFGGSGSSGVSSQSNNNEMILRCQPVPKGSGGSGSVDEGYNPNLGAGGSGYQSEPLRQPEAAPPAAVTPPAEVTPPAAPVTPEQSGAFTPTAPINEEKAEKKDKGLRGLSLTLGGGVEGYSGALAPNINPGPAYGVQAAIRPSSVLGIELAYSGAVNNLDTRVLSTSTSGPDLVRNGGQADLTLGLAATSVQPYLMGGIGVSDYHFRGTSAGFRDDTVGNVPVGAGLRTQIGSFTADLRGDYNFLFSQDFAPTVSENGGNGRYAGTLNIGGTF